MQVQKVRVVVEGKPVRFHIDRGAKRIYHDEPINQFANEADAHEKAERWGLKEYAVEPVSVDIGTPTKLSEIRF